MKTIIMTFVCFCSLAGFSFAGECTSGLCKKSSAANSVRSRGSVTKVPWIVRRPLVTKK